MLWKRTFDLFDDDQGEDDDDQGEDDDEQ